MSDLSPEAKLLLERLKLGLGQVEGLAHLARWIKENTADPRDERKPWSFKDHEFQEEILSCDAAVVDVRKCSQVGMSEASVRLVLAALAVMKNVTGIYTLPSAQFARKFVKSRMDPVIKNSKALASLIHKDNDSSELKQIGGSFLYVGGTWGQQAAISVPADLLVNDEVDFCNQKNLSTYASRLGHAQNGGITRRFSTPTVNGFGITKNFDRSSQAWRAVKCDNCHQWVIPDFFNDVVVPGFDNFIVEFEKEDLDNPAYKVDETMILCNECHEPFSLNNLADPEKRSWIHLYPEREHKGFQVMPYDVPTINTPAKTLKQLAEYDRKADWVNFKVGLPFEDAETSFLLNALNNASVLSAVFPEAGAANGCVWGLDVGKTCWFVIGKPEGRKLNLLYAEQIRQEILPGGQNRVVQRVVELVKMYGARMGVVDAGPDFTIAAGLIDALPDGQVWACQYRKTVKGLQDYALDEAESIVAAERTSRMDRLAKKANTGGVPMPKNLGEVKLVKQHLSNLKRVSQENSQGEMVAVWTKTGPDHYGHALLYMALAADILDAPPESSEVPSVPMMGKIRLRSGDDDAERLVR